MAIRELNVDLITLDTLVAQTISGTVKVDLVPASRTILFYTFVSNTPVAVATSNMAGEWSVTSDKLVKGEKIRALCLGENGENSQVFDNIEIL